MRTLFSLSLTLSLPLLVVLAGCPAPQAPPAPQRETFGDATEAQRSAAIDAAIGGLPAVAATVVFSAELDALMSAGACPTATIVDTEPMVVRYEADDCVAPSGIRYDGVAEVSNLSWEGESSGPMAIELTGFTLEEGGQSVSLSGSVHQSELDPAAEATTISALTLAVDGVEAWVRSTVDCAWDDLGRLCTVQVGSEGSVEGVGTFGIAGTFDLFGKRGGLVLTGTDELFVDFSATDADDCAPIRIDGVDAGEYCFEPVERPPTEPTSGVAAYGWGCVEGDSPLWFFDAETFGTEVADVRLHIATPDGSPTQELHALGPVDGWEGMWEAALVGATSYADGEGTQLACPEEPGLLWEALDAEGNRLDCVSIGDVSGLDSESCR